MDNKVYIDASARHIHLRKQDVAQLFGDENAITPREQDFHMQGQVVFMERLTLVGPKGSIENVSILGPLRNYAQVEISMTDARKLGIDAPVRMSGDHENTPGCTIVGPKGVLKIDKGVIVAKRHVHMDEDHANAIGVQHGDVLTVKVVGTGRSLVFGDVIAEVYPKVSIPTTMHIDTDEANAANIVPGTIGMIIKT